MEKSRIDIASVEAITDRSLDLEESIEFIGDTSTAFIDNARYRWQSKRDFMTSTMTCIFAVDAFDVFIQNDVAYPGIYHFAVTFVFIGLPIYYMQLLLGQYTQLGIIMMKYLSPISHGVAMSVIINLFLRTIRQSIILDDAIVLFITSMQSQLQWLICPPEETTPCYNGTKNCFNLFCYNQTVYLPAHIFYNHHFLNNPIKDYSKMNLVLPEFQKVSIHGICWFFTCVILICTINHYMRVITILRITTIVLLVLLVSVVTLPDLGTSLANLFSVKMESLKNQNAWLSAIVYTLQLLALGRGFHVVHGSYLSAKESCVIYALMVVLLHFLLVVFCSLYTTTCINRVAQYANVDKDHQNLIFEHGRQTLFVLIPQAIGSLGVSQLWSCIYFTVIILINISQQLVHLTFIQMSLSDIYPALLRYKKYGVIIFSLCSGFISCLLVAPESYMIYVITVTKLPLDTSTINVILLTFFVCWVYGVQRFSDDIHFTTGQPPAKIWRICWYIIPLVLIFTFVDNEIKYYDKTQYNERVLHIVMFLVLTSPIPIVAVIETFRFIKARNLMGLFQPDERFGPPDPNERELRRMFNPRTETKSKRRMQVCKHRCLLNSKPLIEINKREIQDLVESEHYDNEMMYEELY